MVDLNESELYPNGRRPRIGPDDAQIKVEIISEFACPACAYFHTTELPRIHTQYVANGDVQVIHGDFAFPQDEFWSYAAGSAALAVYAEQGDEVFFNYTEKLMGLDNEKRSLTKILSSAGLCDIPTETIRETVARAAADKSYKQTMQNIAAAAREQDINRIPAIFINGERIRPPNGDNVRETIESYLTS